MNKITIKVPTGVRFISDVPEIKTTYNNDLPPNAVIDKQVTGVGGSHIALCNEEPYIVAVHLIRMMYQVKSPPLTDCSDTMTT